MIQNALAERKLPPLFAQAAAPDQWPACRAQMVDCLAREVYGITPPAPDRVQAREVEGSLREWAGKADAKRVELSFAAPGGIFSFPVDVVLPCGNRPSPMVVYISFTPHAQGKYLPVEEIVDHGFALASIYYNDITWDGEDGFVSGLAALYPRTGDAAWGKIGMWAFAASRVLDYALTLPEVDASRIYCAGHSRLGKTALWAAAQDTRFAGVFSNDSGCSGAAISRGKVGESIAAIVRQFPYWFCPRYAAYAGREEAQPFDQHFLLAAIAPRPLYVASASEDTWADPESEYLGCLAASPAWQLLGKQGFVAEKDGFPLPQERFAKGDVGYHLRPGTHFLSRYDWARCLDFWQEKQ